ncbi:MAG: plastocyanin/azurin family copper-binding protein [Acidimicrobiia bacterium]
MQGRTRFAAFALAIAAAAVGSTACGSSSKPGSTSTTGAVGSSATAAGPVVTPGPDGTVPVIVQDNVFTPRRLRVRPGTTVRWFNQGFSPHRITASNPDQDFHGAGGAAFGTPAGGFRERESYEFTFTTPGTYDYYCSIHGLPHLRMWARVEVAGA